MLYHNMQKIVKLLSINMVWVEKHSPMKEVQCDYIKKVYFHTCCFVLGSFVCSHCFIYVSNYNYNMVYATITSHIVHFNQ
jgi:hypothetical protein